MHGFSWQKAPNLAVNVVAGQTVLATDGEAMAANFALHVNDKAAAVQQRRAELLQQLQPLGAQRLHWLNQTHSSTVYRVGATLDLQQRDGDALITGERGAALMMMTADCLPVVLVSQSCNGEGVEVACIHAGWRGLANGIIAKTIQHMQTAPQSAWFGAAISQAHFEVGAEVRAAFLQQSAQHATCFVASPNSTAAQPKYLADLYAIARQQLGALGVQQMGGGERCSYAESEQFYSYRRNATTGRMATFVLIA